MNINVIEGYFIDLDGTMLDSTPEQGYISNENLQFLNELQKTKPVVISTGRSPKGAVEDIMKLLGVSYAVCSTGAVIIDKNGKEIHSVYFDNSTKTSLIQYFMDNGFNFILNGVDNIYYKENFNWDKRNWVVRFNKVKYNLLDINQQVRQILVFGPEIEEITKLADFIKVKWPHLSTHTVSGGYSLEITHNTATKGTGNEYVANLLGINIKKCVHIGDSRNDLLALPQTGILIAMDNAETQLKNVANFIGFDFKNGGLAKTIKEFEKEYK
ncbi:Cof-type HAD-IIB family hydrolase [Mycoplasma sp. ES3157-GEN-MYC]|uniref:Cof-type HAD-IIB family hydrolase n=1 Tax=Mycoplasma miroungigenitalium TaxID=754515 RepID=A0A6M4J9G5_9MOLU|nr:Cof-type HAD-IIB family hydrolase [Mycoplasma miroungigenitalium]MBU4690485.1 Cof-type HAD-IIB family hydrolase [Mycoplasma miroungigenitalium]MBU4691752.1 Cof-type HAD-IIB family hydrolase [Mycoplasma miroungigenitalium]QJR43580.1 Cof-type HAD-IIB family hydrolase [Mycoplasma miroungigenitalium]